MSDPDGDQWSAERMQAEFETVLVVLRTLEDQLAEPLWPANSITELETTFTAYKQANLEAASDA